MSQRYDNLVLVDYAELEGKGHWFDGVMTTPFLLQFYQNVLGGQLSKVEDPLAFSIVVGDPAGMGSKHGIQVEQKVHPDQLGRIDAVFDRSIPTWNLKTSNILRFHVDKAITEDAVLRGMVVDGHIVTVPSLNGKAGFDCVRQEDGSWDVS